MRRPITGVPLIDATDVAAALNRLGMPPSGRYRTRAPFRTTSATRSAAKAADGAKANPTARSRPRGRVAHRQRSDSNRIVPSGKMGRPIRHRVAASLAAATIEAHKQRCCPYHDWQAGKGKTHAKAVTATSAAGSSRCSARRACRRRRRPAGPGSHASARPQPGHHRARAREAEVRLELPRLQLHRLEPRTPAAAATAGRAPDPLPTAAGPDRRCQRPPCPVGTADGDQNARTLSTRRCRSSPGANAGSRRCSPYPAARSRSRATPRPARYVTTASARRSDSRRL